MSMIKNSVRRSWRHKEEEEDKYPRMTKEAILRNCKENKLYMTPRLNDVLYLHFKGYSKIENLEEYSGLKCLWLENNGINKIENLDNQKELRSLYLHNNLIREIENLEDSCPLLDSLNLCHNNVSKIQNLSRLASLHTLNISHNRLQDVSDLEHLKECKELSCLDLSHNWIEDPQVVDIFAAMENLRVLYLTGNPVIKKIPAYRKSLTVKCKMLTYLDDRPVFPKDRAAAEAWSEGGLEAERACRQKWAEEERSKITESVRSILSLRNKSKAEREAAMKVNIGDNEENEDEAIVIPNEEEQHSSSSEQEETFGDYEGMEGGDSENNNQINDIILPWMHRDEPSDLRTRRENNYGEGGRSLIVEISDTPNEEAAPPKHVGKGFQNEETRSKLHEALRAAEWLNEDPPPEEKTEQKPPIGMAGLLIENHNEESSSVTMAEDIRRPLIEEIEENDVSAMDTTSESAQSETTQKPLIVEIEESDGSSMESDTANALFEAVHKPLIVEIEGSEVSPMDTTTDNSLTTEEKPLISEIEEVEVSKSTQSILIEETVEIMDIDEGIQMMNLTTENGSDTKLKLNGEQSVKAREGPGEDTEVINEDLDRTVVAEVNLEEESDESMNETLMDESLKWSGEQEIEAILDEIIERVIKSKPFVEVLNEEETNRILDNAIKVVDELNSIGYFTQQNNTAEVPKYEELTNQNPESESSTQLYEAEIAPLLEEQTVSVVDEQEPMEIEDQTPEVIVYEKNIARSLELQIVADKDSGE